MTPPVKNIQELVQGAEASTESQTSTTHQWLQRRLQSWNIDLAGQLNPQTKLSLGEGNASFVATLGDSAAVAAVIGLSASRGEGLDILLDSLQQKVTETTGSADQGEGYMITR